MRMRSSSVVQAPLGYERALPGLLRIQVVVPTLPALLCAAEEPPVRFVKDLLCDLIPLVLLGFGAELAHSVPDDVHEVFILL